MKVVGGFVIVRGKMVDRMSTSPIYKLYILIRIYQSPLKLPKDMALRASTCTKSSSKHLRGESVLYISTFLYVLFLIYMLKNDFFLLIYFHLLKSC